MVKSPVRQENCRITPRSAARARKARARRPAVLGASDSHPGQRPAPGAKAVRLKPAARIKAAIAPAPPRKTCQRTGKPATPAKSVPTPKGIRAVSMINNKIK